MEREEKKKRCRTLDEEGAGLQIEEGGVGAKARQGKEGSSGARSDLERKGQARASNGNLSAGGKSG